MELGFYCVKCRPMGAINRLRVPTFVVGRILVFPIVTKGEKTSDCYDFLNIVL